MVAVQESIRLHLQLVQLFLLLLQVAHHSLSWEHNVSDAKDSTVEMLLRFKWYKIQLYRVALLLLGDVDVDVLVSPVEHELLLLPLVHPHDGSGDLLDDVLELTQLTHAVVGHFLTQTKKHGYTSDAQRKRVMRAMELKPFFFCKRVRLYLQAVPFLLQDLEVVPVALLVLEKRDFVCL